VLTHSGTESHVSEEHTSLGNAEGTQPLAHDPHLLETGVKNNAKPPSGIAAMFGEEPVAAPTEKATQPEAQVNHARNIEEGRAELERRQRAVEYQRKTAQFIENFMLDYPGQEPPDFWDPYNNVKELILHDQTKRRGIFQSHELYGKDDLTSEHSEFARRYDEDWYAEGKKKTIVPARYYSSIDKVRYRVVIPSLNKKGLPGSIPTMDLEGTSGRGRRQSLVTLLGPSQRVSADDRI